MRNASFFLLRSFATVRSFARARLTNRCTDSHFVLFISVFDSLRVRCHPSPVVSSVFHRKLVFPRVCACCEPRRTYSCWVYRRSIVTICREFYVHAACSSTSPKNCKFRPVTIRRHPYVTSPLGEFMAQIITGSARLRARTLLHNPRYIHPDIHGLSHSVIFDANVECVWSSDQSILCSLRYNLRFPGETVHAGIYDIVAKASVYAYFHACLTLFS